MQINHTRIVISFNGEWSVAESLKELCPSAFPSTVQVPGLIDLARPTFDEVGVESSRRNYFWYKTTFSSPDVLPEIALLKVRQAKYGMKAYLNGNEIGEHPYNFTPVEFDIRDHLSQPGQENELIIRLGAHPGLLPDYIVWGHDFEKIKYIPGIYDDVELIFSGGPFINNIQVAPDIRNGLVKVLTWMESEEREDYALTYRIFEAESGNLVLEKTQRVERHKPLITLNIPNARLWSPDDPFLYRIEVSSEGDSFSTRFGMREFRFNPVSGYPKLNDETIFLRGTNICLYRFYEDELRTTQPWDKAWVRKLLTTIKDMQWNSFRFTICLAPEFWYDLCDEIGLIVQDEYPIWYGAKAEDFPSTYTADELAKEYQDWMEERWNHASVLIWDAQNESVTDVTGDALMKVRGLDLSNRPWDNGYSPPQLASDPIESHPYILQNFLGRKPEAQGALYPYLHKKSIPDNGPSELYPPTDGGIYPNPIVNNENVFLWITRDGSPTQLTKSIFKNLYGETSLTTNDYNRLNSYTFNRIISYWRAYRTSAAVQEFCLLGYSRGMETGGFTSDNFVDVNALKFRPYYRDYAYNAFYPVGLLINRWEEYFQPGKKISIPIIMINDEKRDWRGTLEFYLSRDKEEDRGFRVYKTRE